MSTSATAARAIVPAWSQSSCSVGDLQGRQPPGHIADEGHAVRAEIEEPRREEAADHEDERAGDARCDRPQPEDDDQRDDADDDGRPVRVAEGPEPGPQLLERVRAGDVGPGELGKLADHDVDRRAEQEAGDHGPGQELRDPAHPEHGEEEEQAARRERDHRDERRRRPVHR